MNVLIVVPWDQEFGGVASVVHNLARHLESRGDRVLFLHPGSPARAKEKVTRRGHPGYELYLRDPRVPGHAYRSVPAFVVTLPWVLRQLMGLIRSHRIDVVNIHFAGQGFLPVAIACRLLGVKLVTSIHGADIFDKGTGRAKRCRWMEALFWLSDRIVAPSKAFRNDFLAAFPGQHARSTFIHNGLDASELEIGSGEPLEQRRSSPFLLAVAMHLPWKGLDVLLRALAELRARGQVVRAVLVGDGPLRQELEALADDLGIADQVEFTGVLGRMEVARLLHSSSAVVFPSRSEPFGFVAVEAMACARPIIASAVGGLREIVDHEVDGLLVEPDDPVALADSIERVLSDHDLRDRLARTGHAKARSRFGLERFGDDYVRLFRSLLSCAPGLSPSTNPPPSKLRPERKSAPGT